MNQNSSDILLVDTFSSDGHRAIIRILITCLRENGWTITAVGSHGYFEELGLPADAFISRPLPLHLSNQHHGPIKYRLQLLRQLRFIDKHHITKGKWAHVIFAYFDEISLAAAMIRSRLVLLNHNNVSGLHSAIKLWCFRRVTRNATLVVFDPMTELRARQLGATSTVHEPHGLDMPRLEPARLPLSCIDARLQEVPGRKILFAPNSSHRQEAVLNQYVGKPEFEKFLKENGLTLVLGQGSWRSCSENVVALRSPISDAHYQSLMARASGMVVAYPSSFAYRTSALLMECFAHQKPCVLSDIPAFRLYEAHFSYHPFFSNLKELQAAILRMLALDRTSAYQSLDVLRPSYSFLRNADCADRPNCPA